MNCKDLLTSQDKVEIVKATYDYIAGKDGLWNRLLQYKSASIQEVWSFEVQSYPFRDKKKANTDS